MLVRLIYASHETGPADTTVISDILDSCRRYNLPHDITGLLCYGNARFIQYVEGDRNSINALYAKIIGDRRHRDIVLLDYAGIEQKTFESWTMGFVSIDNMDTIRLIKKSAQMNSFMPELMTGWQALSFVQSAKDLLFPQIELTGKSGERASSLMH